MNHRSLSVLVVAIVAGLVAPYLPVVASSVTTELIEPGARVSAFLLGHPRHPVQLALAVPLLHFVAGLGAGSVLALVAARAHFSQPWLLWLVLS